MTKEINTKLTKNNNLTPNQPNLTHNGPVAKIPKHQNTPPSPNFKQNSPHKYQTAY
jgi:hypothetical protein